MENANNQKQIETKQNPDDKKGYLDAFQDAFHRIWKNRFLWFWGIFLPSGFSMGLNFNYSADESNFSQTPTDEEKIIQTVQTFTATHWQLVIAAVALFVFFVIIMWILSAISRRGVIRTLDQLQNKEKPPIFKWTDVWREGKSEYLRIIKLDVALTLLIMAVFVALALPIGFMFATKRIIAATFLTLIGFVIFIPLIFLINFVKNISVIFISLANTRIIRSIEGAYNLTLKNLREALKFLLLSFLLGLAKFFVAIAGVFIIGIFTAIIAVIIKSSMENFVNPTSITIGVILFLVFFVAMLLIHSFFALWQMDLWLWWTKKLGGVKASETKTETEKEIAPIPVKDTEPVVGAGS